MRDADFKKLEHEFLPLIPRIDDERKEYLEREIMEVEVEEAIEKLNPAKSPGPDELFAAFYKTFKHDVSPILTVVLIEAYNSIVLPSMYRSSHAVIMPRNRWRRKTKIRHSVSTLTSNIRYIYM